MKLMELTISQKYTKLEGLESKPDTPSGQMAITITTL